MMHEAIKDRVSERRLADRGMPLLDEELPRHEGGPAPVAVAIIEEFQEIAGVVGERSQPQSSSTSRSTLASRRSTLL